MRRLHRVLWHLAAVPVGVAGLFLAYVTVPGAALGLSSVIGCAAALVLLLDIDHVGLTARKDISRLGETALLAVACTASTVGYVVSVGPGGFVLALLVAVTSPAMLCFCTRYGRSMKQQATAALRWDVVIEAMACAGNDWAGMSAAGSLCWCTDERLCELWAESTCALEAATSPQARSLLVETREGYLQEMEHRNPSGVMAWMVDDAAAGDPLGFLVERGHPAPVVDWDQLIL